MASLNRVQILGNLGSDPEMRYTTNQIPVATFSVATKEFRLIDGNKQDYTEWHKIVTWNKLADNCSKYLGKGSSVFVEGKLQTRSWDDKNGNKRYTTEIVANNVQFLSSPNSQKVYNSENKKSDNIENVKSNQDDSILGSGVDLNNMPF